MSLIIFKDEIGHDVGIDPLRVVYVENHGIEGLSVIALTIPHHGVLLEYTVKHPVNEVVEAINRVIGF